MSRSLLAEWVDQMGPFSGLTERKEFDNFMTILVKDIANENSRVCLESLLNGIGSYIKCETLVMVSATLIKTLTGKFPENIFFKKSRKKLKKKI